MMRYQHIRRFLRWGLALFAIAAAVAAVSCRSKDGPSLPPPTGSGAPPAPSIPALKELSGAVPATQTTPDGRAGTGSLHARHQAQLGPKASGVISFIGVEEGDRVKKGQLLFRLEAAQAALATEQARTALSSAQVQLDSAKLDFDRAKLLFDKGSIAPAAFDQAKSRYDAAASTVEQAKAAVNLAERHATDTAVYSPIAGVVAEKRMNVGETATMMPPSVVLVVQDIDALELRARLPETALKGLSEGSEITVRLSALDETRRVRIKRIAPTVDPRTRTIEIVADVDNADHRLKAGMLAEVAYEEHKAPPSVSGATLTAGPPKTGKPLR